MRTSAGLVFLLACLLEPFIPSFSLKVLKQLNVPPETCLSLVDENGDLERARKPWELLPAGHKIGTPEPVFNELRDEDVEALREKFSGSQADRVVRAEAEAKKMVEKLKETKLSDGNQKKHKSKKCESEVQRKKSCEQKTSISRLDIRVGLIKEVRKHPDADSLYVKEIDVGEAASRTVVSDLVKHVPPEEMLNRNVCVICNLKPAILEGVESQAMVLTASDETGTKVELVEAPEWATVGERVRFPGFEGGEGPDQVVYPKKKIWERLQSELHTDTHLFAFYKDLPFTTSAGLCKVKSIPNGVIKFS